MLTDPLRRWQRERLHGGGPRGLWEVAEGAWLAGGVWGWQWGPFCRRAAPRMEHCGGDVGAQGQSRRSQCHLPGP